MSDFKVFNPEYDSMLRESFTKQGIMSRPYLAMALLFGIVGSGLFILGRIMA